MSSPPTSIKHEVHTSNAESCAARDAPCRRVVFARMERDGGELRNVVDARQGR